MPDTDRVRSLPRITPPALTVYVNTNPATRRNQGHPPGYLAWLKTSEKKKSSFRAVRRSSNGRVFIVLGKRPSIGPKARLPRFELLADDERFECIGQDRRFGE
jgi:hypothetical protein